MVKKIEFIAGNRYRSWTILNICPPMELWPDLFLVIPLICAIIRAWTTVQIAKTIIDLFPRLDEIWLIARKKDRLEKFAILSMIDLNVKGFTMVNRVCLPYMKNGSLGIMTCSISSFCPVPNQAVYSASKIYVQYLSRALHEEVQKDGIRILAMCPGNMDTEMNPKGGTSQSDKVDKLPFLNMETITRKSILLARKGHAIYTPGGFYKAYRLASKILPASWMIKIIGKSFD